MIIVEIDLCLTEAVASLLSISGYIATMSNYHCTKHHQCLVEKYIDKLISACMSNAPRRWRGVGEYIDGSIIDWCALNRPLTWIFRLIAIAIYTNIEPLML